MHEINNTKAKNVNGRRSTLRVWHIVMLCTCAILFSCKEESRLIRTVKLDQYSSASTVERYKDKLYVMGDDAPYALVLNLQLQVVDTIHLFQNTLQRIPKKQKADIECGSVFSDSTLLWLGSGSIVNRQFGWRFHLVTKDTQQIAMESFYERLKLSGIGTLNLEGMAVTPQQVILANRGNEKNPVNSLIFTSHAFWKEQDRAKLSVVRAGHQPKSNKSKGFVGISGLTYSTRFDRLFTTVSTEKSTDGIKDGPIGESYIWVFDDISTKRNFLAINPSNIIDLNEVDARFKGQKIESAAILEENNQFIWLVLTADNDDGTTTLFEIKVPNKAPEGKGSNFWDL